jgi:hypothetical protein
MLHVWQCMLKLCLHKWCLYLSLEYSSCWYSEKNPGFEGGLGPHNVVFERIGIQRLDNINLVDVFSNLNRVQHPPNA